MIKYTLRCEQDHQFDSWFQSSCAYEKLAKSGHLSCAVCGSGGVKKAMMAPRVTAKKKDKAPKSAGPLSAPASPAEQAIQELRKKVTENADDVGRNFASEARAIHNGEAPERAIYGEAKIADAKSLIDDGIPVRPLPWRSGPTNS